LATVLAVAKELGFDAPQLQPELVASLESLETLQTLFNRGTDASAVLLDRILTSVEATCTQGERFANDWRLHLQDRLRDNQDLVHALQQYAYADAQIAAGYLTGEFTALSGQRPFGTDLPDALTRAFGGLDPTEFARVKRNALHLARHTQEALDALNVQYQELRKQADAIDYAVRNFRLATIPAQFAAFTSAVQALCGAL
jgi:hypothetical protein